MRVWPLLLLAALPGCGPEPVGALLAADAATVVVFGRGIVDLGVSAISGRDCSIVRLDRRQSYCAPREGQAPPQPYCTRSLGTVDCWLTPALSPGAREPVGDTPPPTPAQSRDRAAPWPKSLHID